MITAPRLALTAILCTSAHAAGPIDLTRSPTSEEIWQDVPAPSRWRVEGPWLSMARTADGHRIWTTALPLDPLLLGRQEAGVSAVDAWEPQGVTLRLDGEPMPWQRHPEEAGRWSYSRVRLHLTLPASSPRPRDVTLEGLPLVAAQRRGVMHLTEGTERHHGIGLQPGDAISWDLTLPEGARLETVARRLPPVVRPRDRALAGEVRWTLHHAGSEHLLASQPATRAQRISASLRAWQGLPVRLTVAHTGSPSSDGVFLAAPAVLTPTPSPRRVVVVMLDTVRRDHLGLYGYDRDTTPRLDAWAAGARVFEHARTVSPWTLPSTQAALTGAQPEWFANTPTLAERLTALGWHTEGVVANIYLSPRFGLHRGFARYHTEVLLDGHRVAQRATEALDRYPHRDTFVFVQLMDAHLPYRESPRYRWRFTADAPDAPEGFLADTLAEIRTLRAGDPAHADARDYTIARYDNNLRLIDDALGALLGRLRAEDTVLIFADHGEELWDHGGFEHGHSFYDELLRVPLLIRGPGVAPGRDHGDASLLDLTPTLLALLGVPHDPIDGRDLLADIPPTLQSFGRPLYGDNGWGYVARGRKWMSRSGTTQAFDLRADPGEHHPLRPHDDLGHADTLSAHLRVPVHRVSIVSQPSIRAPAPVTLRAEHPSGIQEAWLGPDPRGWSARATLELVHESVSLTVPEGAFVPRELYLRHEGDVSEVRLWIDTGTGPIQMSRDAGATPWPVQIRQGWAPALGHRVDRPADALTEDALRELGYLD